ncbi:MAG: aminoacylase [[Candidatus Thermochlorobacteriaceae] bacterium GBChlB]|nr:MAG: aminoacylase [[Candidatus Thermochlorobacteriaceae] bacterium GBChlB]
MTGWLMQSSAQEYDLIIRNGTIYDGYNLLLVKGDLAVNADTIAAVGNLTSSTAKREIDATGLTVAPGFINMLSWSTQSLITDGRAQSTIRQGVTLEVMGEGTSMGPLSPEMKKGMQIFQNKGKKIEWTTLGEYLEFLEKRGVSTNVASYVGATTLRQYFIGNVNRAPTKDELEKMKKLARAAMEEGALGIGSALIYTPAAFAKTDELIELCKAVAPYGGIYVSHLRSEGNRFEQAVDELITIAKEADIHGEIFHLKAAGKANWHKLDAVIKKIDSARAAGLSIAANMYTYTAGATGLDAAMPPWVQEGGFDAWRKRLSNKKIREQLKKEISTPSDEWENLYLAAGTTDNVVFVGFRNRRLRKYIGKTLTDVAKERRTSPEETIMDLVMEDGSRVETVYFMMSEDNVKKQLKLPYMTFGSDAGSMSPEGVFLLSNPHPRAYGNFARLLGKYVRDEKVIPLDDAIRKLTSLPAEKLKLTKRGSLKIGNYADVVVFDAAAIQDHATFEKPHQFSTGVKHVFVNGVQVLKDGEHTGAKPGRVVRGAGWRGWKK